MTEALFYLVEPDYLKAMGTPLLRGVGFCTGAGERACSGSGDNGD